jgi:geranyl-CoA carboxylase alpha subunit
MSFGKILVANRGEIAARVMRTARAMGCRTVAVYSTADAGAEHVRQADQSVWIGESLPAQSYLNIAAIVDAALASGAQAVHPGYGFLAENAGFAQACRDAGLVFIVRSHPRDGRQGRREASDAGSRRAVHSGLPG